MKKIINTISDFSKGIIKDFSEEINSIFIRSISTYKNFEINFEEEIKKNKFQKLKNSEKENNIKNNKAENNFYELEFEYIDFENINSFKISNKIESKDNKNKINLNYSIIDKNENQESEIILDLNEGNYFS